MKKTLQIARLELSLLFYSPIAWLLMIALFFQVAYGFIDAIQGMQRQQEWYKYVFSFLTSNVFTKPGQGILGNLLNTLYLYMPLITMSLISRETSSGTIKLLYSSPLKISQIVLGKFYAMMAYNLILIGLLSLVVTGGWISIDHFGLAQALSALLGIYLLLCAYAAIGLFMSSLTTYQVVAAVSTFMVFAFLSYIGSFWQGIDFLRDLTYSLSMPGRTVKMMMGFLTTRDVIYFIVIVYIFLALTICKLHMARDARSIWFRVSRYAFVVVSGLMVSYLTSRQQFIGYYDATATKRNTLRQNTQDVLKQAGDAPIEITEYVNLLDGTYGRAAPDQRIRELDRWEPYLRFKSNITLKWVYYYDSIPDPGYYDGMNKGKTLKEIFEKRAKYLEINPAKFKTPEEIRQLIDLRSESNRLVMQVKYKGNATFLRVFDDNDFWPGETEIATCLKRLMVKAPEILFVNDGYERSISKIGGKDYKMLTDNKTARSSMVNRGFDVDTISLKDEEIPAGISALVIADRRVDPDTAILAKLNNYIDNGGNLFIAAEKSKLLLNNSLLKPLGIQMMNGTIVQPTRDFANDWVISTITEAGSGISELMEANRTNGVPVSMPGAAGLSYIKNGAFSVNPLLMTDSISSWNKLGAIVLDSANAVYEEKEGDQRGSFPTALFLTRNVHGKQQRIIVTSDADLLSNAELNQGNIHAANYDFANSVFSWFSDNAFPIFAKRPPSQDNQIMLSEPQVKIMKIVYLVIIPLLMFGMGTILLIRRKRQ